jgi:tripartite-type tricarboxylate transporter receptor subunit TctC
MVAGTSNAAHIKAGKLRAIAVTGLERSDQHPELPSIADTYPGFEVTIWLGIFAPAGMPAAIMNRLREATTQALAAPDVKEKFQAAGGLRPLTLKPAEFSALIERDSEKYKAVIRQKSLAID